MIGGTIGPPGDFEFSVKDLTTKGTKVHEGKTAALWRGCERLA
jgi:hypothetical protein